MNRKKSRPSRLVLIDGAGGYVGGHLVEEFARSGYRVRATDMQRADFSVAEKAGAEVIPADILNPAELKKIMKGVEWLVHPAAVFDLGAPWDVLCRVNVDGTKNVCQAAVEAGVKKMLHFSTGGVYGKPRFTPTTEEHPHRPIDAYSRSKEMAEKVIQKYVRDHGLHVLLFRPTAVYGPRGKYVAGTFMSLPFVLKGFGISRLPLIRGGQLLNMIHVEDIARAAVFVLERNDISPGEAFNLADSDIQTAEDFFTTYVESNGMSVLFRVPYPRRTFDLVFSGLSYLPSSSLEPLNRWLGKKWGEVVKKYDLVPALAPKIARDSFSYFMGDHAYTNTKLLNLGFKLKYPGFREGWLETVKWYRDNRWLPPA
ncbi:MAG: NAD-dependent epimerase/dehydratase family protein [bacterium]|nr:NAD-dependent epimerase/dehydratase family protein [bacterium]